MFRALGADHQEVKIVLYSIWYQHACRWPFGAVHGTATYMIPFQVRYIIYIFNTFVPSDDKRRFKFHLGETKVLAPRYGLALH